MKRLVLRVIPDEATRLAALKRGEVDIAYSIRAELAEELQRTPGLTLKPTVIQSPFWLYFADSGIRSRHGMISACARPPLWRIDHKTINQALTLGYSLITGSIIPESFEFYWKPPAPVYDPGKAKELLSAAGFPNGFDAGFYTCDISYGNLAEAVLNNLGAGRHSREAASVGAGRILQGLRRQGVQEHRPGSGGRVRQRGDPAAGVRGQGRRLCLWQLS